MRALSATECITPAINRTKQLLFTPFRKGRSWKLSATAYLCRLGTMFFPFPLIYLALLPMVRGNGMPAVIALCVAVLIGTGLVVYVFYLCSRLQFAYLDIMIYRGQFVAPAWRKYGPQSRRWTGLKIILGIAISLACAAPIAIYLRHVIPIFRAMNSLAPGQPAPPEFIGAIFAGYGLALLVFGLFFLASSLLADFLVPSLALENTSLAEAFHRMTALIRQEPGEFALYTVLKIGLAVATYMGAMIAAEIVIVLLTLILFLIAGMIGFVLHLIGIPSAFITALGILLAIVWYVFVVGYCLMLALGSVMTFLDAYALYFLGGRYPLLGNLLEPPPPPEPAAVPLLPDLPPAMPLESGAL